jgi:hypothetical protein
VCVPFNGAGDDESELKGLYAYAVAYPIAGMILPS